MLENGFSSPRTDNFPAGLRVLVVDDDMAWLRILEKMLKKCSYEVTTCCLAREALDLLRERKDGFDIVISDVNMPDMDGFKLLEHVGLEMDLPVIMMSVDGETSRVMRGVQHGACDYLLKPIRMKELRNIWQHVFRKKIHEVRDIEHEGFDEIQLMRNGYDQFDEGLFLSAGEVLTGKKRKDAENEREYGDSSSVKKARVVWTVDLHQKFVNAVNQIGFEKVGPKKILDLMNVPWLTRENVASHLQKYRLYLTRLQRENELKASFSGIKQFDIPKKDPIGILGLQKPINLQHHNVGNKPPAQNGDLKFHECDLKSIVSMPIQEPKKQPVRDNTRNGLTNSFGTLEPDVKHDPFEPIISESHFWNDITKTQLKKDDGFNQISQPGPHHHLQLDDGVQFSPTISPRPFKAENKRMEHTEMKLPYTSIRSQQITEKLPTRGATNLLTFPNQGENDIFPILVSDPIPSTSPSMNYKGSKQVHVNYSELGQGNLLLESVPGIAASNGDLFGCLIQGDNYKASVELQNKETFSTNYPELFAETTAYSFDPQRLDYEYPWESIEYPVIDQGLFIV